MNNNNNNNNEKYKIITIFGAIIGIMALAISFFIISKNILIDGTSYTRSILSNSFLLATAIIAITLSLFASKRVDEKLKYFTTSLFISFLIQLLSLVAIITIVTLTKSISIHDSVSFSFLFLLTTIIYSFIYSLTQLIYKYSIKYTILYNIILFTILLISTHYNWWIFQWFAIFIVFNLLISIIKKRETLKIKTPL